MYLNGVHPQCQANGELFLFAGFFSFFLKPFLFKAFCCGLLYIFLDIMALAHCFFLLLVFQKRIIACFLP